MEPGEGRGGVRDGASEGRAAANEEKELSKQRRAAVLQANKNGKAQAGALPLVPVVDSAPVPMETAGSTPAQAPSTAPLLPQPAVHVPTPLPESSEQLKARVAELEAENIRLREERKVLRAFENNDKNFQVVFFSETNKASKRFNFQRLMLSY